MEAYRENKKITKDKEGEKAMPLTLPLNIKQGEGHAKGGETAVWKIQTQNEQGVEQITVALKENKREIFNTDEEMQRAKKFYEFLKNFPGFGKFVPDTLFFKARETADKEPQAYCIQKFSKGERIDRLTDDIIYKEPAVVAQLLELADASIKVLQTTRQEDLDSPDFMRTPELSNPRVLFGATILDPRYSSNIIIADKPDKNGQRVFFVDAGVNANARMKVGWEHSGRKIVNLIAELHFKSWKRKLEKILNANPK